MTDAGVAHAFLVAAQIGTPPTADNAYVAGQVDADPTRFSMFLDLDSRWSDNYHDGGTAERLRALGSQFPLLGVTHYLADEPDDWWGSPDADALGTLLDETGLALSLHAPPVWHRAVAGWAERHPSVAVLLHHQGLVHTDDEATVLATLASAAGVRVKVSGFSYVSAGEQAPFAAAFGRLRRTLDAFGPDRMLWGSDFPVSPERGIDYRMSLDLVRDGFADLGADDLAAILGGNALRLRDRIAA